MTLQAKTPQGVSRTKEQAPTLVGHGITGQGITGALADFTAGTADVRLPKNTLEAMAQELRTHTQEGPKLPENPETSRQLAPLTTTLTSASRSYPDSRTGYPVQLGVDFTVTLSREVSGREVLQELLGEQADTFISRNDTRVYFDRKVPQTFTGTLFLDSNIKSRDYDGTAVNQADDLRAAGQTHVNHLHAMIIFAALLKKVNEGRPLNAEESDLKDKLSNGSIVTDRGHLSIGADRAGSLFLRASYRLNPTTDSNANFDAASPRNFAMGHATKWI